MIGRVLPAFLLFTLLAPGAFAARTAAVDGAYEPPSTGPLSDAPAASDIRFRGARADAPLPAERPDEETRMRSARREANAEVETRSDAVEGSRAWAAFVPLRDSFWGTVRPALAAARATGPDTGDLKVGWDAPAAESRYTVTDDDLLQLLPPRTVGPDSGVSREAAPRRGTTEIPASPARSSPVAQEGAVRGSEPLKWKEHADFGERAQTARSHAPGIAMNPARFAGSLALQIALALALLAALAAALYSRIDRKAAANQATRRRILTTLKDRPGLTAADLARELGLLENGIRYHLRVLGREGFVVERRAKGKIHCYLAGDPSATDCAAAAALSVPSARALHEAIRTAPGRTSREITGATGLQPDTVHHQGRRLADAGLVRIERDGRAHRYFAV